MVILRSISLLDQTEQISNNDLIEVSKYGVDGKYTSKKATVDTVIDTVSDGVKSELVQTYGLNDDDSQPINVNEIKAQVKTLSAEDTTIYGQKTFTEIPSISVDSTAYADASEYAVPNLGYIDDRIISQACYIADSYKVDADPGADAVPPEILDSETWMHWHIDDQGTDTTQWMDPLANNEKTAIDGIRCYQTGYLTIFGWLADNGGIMLPQNAWVALYGRMKIPNPSKPAGIDDGKWVLLQIQPWIRGSYSSQLQYVGFNLPVHKDLFLKIKTGFKVNGNVGGYMSSNSITFGLNQPNSFVGYIVRQDDAV